MDLSKTESIARTWIGIVTYKEMAECLGWPRKELGYADIIALRNDPKGWASYPCSQAKWGQRPLLAFTDPTTSSTGRSVLFSLFAIGSHKAPDQLTAADVSDPEVVGYVRSFQQLVDHYMPTTLAMNTKVYQGPHYGHFFMLPEDNLIHLHEGTEKAFINGVEVTAPALDTNRPVVMIYPKEGSAEHNHSASVPEAPWITAEQREAADDLDQLLAAGRAATGIHDRRLRSVTGLPPGEKISAKYGLDPTKPTVVVNPTRTEQGAFTAIVQSWGEVKRPGIVTFVADTSGSMSGDKLKKEKDGLIRAFDGMARANQVGLVTFGGTVGARVPVAPLADNRFRLQETVNGLSASGETALYDAIKSAIEMTDAAPGDERAIRAVVVLTDGKANRGNAKLNDIIRMESDECPVALVRGPGGQTSTVNDCGSTVAKTNVIGTALAIQTRHPIQIFYIGVGKDADLEIGRMSAQATGAEYQATPEEELAKVIDTFKGYF